MASGVGGAGGASGPNRFSNKNEGDGDNPSSGKLGEHKLSSDFVSAREKLEKHFRQENPGRTSPGVGKPTSPNKGMKHALKNVWEGVKGVFGKTEKPKVEISSPNLPTHVKFGVRSPGLEEVKVKFHRGSQGEPHIVVEKKEEGSSGEEVLEEIPGGGGSSVSETGSNKSPVEVGASGFKGVLQSGAKGITKFAERVAGIFSDKTEGAGEGGSVVTSSHSEIPGIVTNEPTGPATGLTLQEMLEVEKNLSELIEKSPSGARQAQLKKWRGSVERDRKRLTGSDGVNREEQLDVMGCSDAELQQAVAEGLAVEDALKELDKVLEDAEKDMDSSEVSGPASSGSRRSVHTEEGSGIEETRSDAVGQQQKIHWLRRLLLFLLRVVRSFLRSAKQKLINARRAAMEWIRRACPCRHGVYQVNLDEDEVRRQRTAEWVTRHFGSGRGGVVLTEETVNHLSGDASLEGEEWKVETYFRDFQNLIEKTEGSDIRPTSGAVRVLAIFTRGLGDWLPSIGFSK
ncbi:hypothetical protein [Chlamydia pecorum]|uniref:hypothetical protein n=1 Tax=Chlamydia pecorum TaxID=85991 RepID=UPI001D06EADC|nr:hypothetical protein [Chlamydia pecorum]UBV32105.1 Cpec specific hypothetical protein [Chlamydia pecorum]